MTVPAGVVIDGRYKVVRLLGEGGYGAVYLAEDTRLGNKPIALKESFNKSTAAQEQFRLEAQLLAELNHPGLPRVTDHFLEKDGRQFLVMDYIEGEDLDQRIIRLGRAMPEREAVALMLQICDAVAYLHTRQPRPIIHRDIKPPNIKITREGRAILVDFGIAKVYDPGRGTAKIAKAVTPHFSPPEQHIAKTDTRSDVYSLGATLYLLVTADLPPDAMDRLDRGEILIPPSHVNPIVSPAVEKIILQALELLPERRFMNANRMAAALKACLQIEFSPGNSGEMKRKQSPTGKVCPRCGWQNRARARFCVMDGTPLDKSAPVKSPAPAQPIDKALSPEMILEKANQYAQKREFSKAILEYEHCLQKGLTDLAIYHNLGFCYLEEGRYSEAANILEKGVGRYPKDGDLFYQLARTYEALNLDDQALRASKRACELAPKDAVNLSQYGRLLMDARRYSEAVRQLEKSVSLDPDSISTQILLGRAYGENKNLRQAVNALHKTALLDPKLPDPHYWTGYFYFKAGKRRQARAALEQALRISSQFQQAQDLLKKM